MKINLFIKKFVCYLFLVFGFWSLVFGFINAYDTSDTGWKITGYNVNADISSNQKVDVTEIISVDFGELSKHGLYRYIPYKYQRKGNSYNVRIKINSITDSEGKRISYKESKSGGNLELKIGETNSTVSGAQEYKINYELDRVINSFKEQDEFYWNITGNDWPVSVEKSEITVKWPDGAEIVNNICYVGSYGSPEQNCHFDLDNNAVVFVSDTALNPGEGFSVASAVKPGTIKPYSWGQKVFWFLFDNWAYLIPLLVLIWLIVKYLKFGRDPEGKKTIVPEFAPPDKLKPAVMGTIYDEKVDPKDISSVIIDLAVNGYIKIKEIKSKGIFGFESKDYEFIYTGKDKKDLANYEKQIMLGIFGSGNVKKMSELKNSFYTHVKTVKNDLYEEVTKLGYFADNPEMVRNIYLGIGITLMFIGMFVPSFLAIFSQSIFSYMFAFIASGILIIIFSFSMPKRTSQGVETNRKIEGFKLYMHTAERYRQKFNEKEKIFERFLPYAMVFGIVKEWAKKFKDMQIERPDWYTGDGVFYAVVFASHMESMQNSMNSTLVAPSSAGAGGSGFSGGGSGGGFGGGGGGSW